MRIYLIAAGTRMPAWVQHGYSEYARRLPSECALQLVEIPLVKRTRGASSARVVEEEGERLLAAVPKSVTLLALDRQGQAWATRELAAVLAGWIRQGQDVALLLGGPDGLAPLCIARAQGRWSLSPLTLPHGLVRIVVAEQLYRAWSILNHHPYHR